GLERHPRGGIAAGAAVAAGCRRLGRQRADPDSGGRHSGQLPGQILHVRPSSCADSCPLATVEWATAPCRRSALRRCRRGTRTAELIARAVAAVALAALAMIHVLDLPATLSPTPLVGAGYFGVIVGATAVGAT